MYYSDVGWKIPSGHWYIDLCLASFLPPASCEPGLHHFLAELLCLLYWLYFPREELTCFLRPKPTATDSRYRFSLSSKVLELMKCVFCMNSVFCVFVFLRLQGFFTIPARLSLTRFLVVVVVVVVLCVCWGGCLFCCRYCCVFVVVVALLLLLLLCLFVCYLNHEGTNSSKMCVWFLCMYVRFCICVWIDFADFTWEKGIRTGYLSIPSPVSAS